MSSYLSASWIYPVSSAPLKNGVIAISENGTITGVFTALEAQEQKLTPIKQYTGVIVPGLINTHCHLELSHLKGKIAMHTGLPGFVQQVMQQREKSAEEINAAMLTADEEMYLNGIVAVGDISNQVISREVKSGSSLYYHTFVEAMGFNPIRAAEIIEKAKETASAFSPLKATVVPHAPYSVSGALFAEIAQLSNVAGDAVSIHNQETMAENDFFATKTGHFLNLYSFLGLDISFFKPAGKTSLQTYLPLLSTAPRTLLVHNTFTSRKDIEFATAIHGNLYWCLCPNANQYIEDRLPDVELLKRAGVKITLGTDSLASNHGLSILAEMKTIQDNYPVRFEELLRWATLNGADFLGISARFGSLEIDKAPGINLIEGLVEERITDHTRIRRLY